jgi:hypothetical protein
MSVALAFVMSALLTAGLLWAVSWLSGARIPLVDLLIIAGLCAGLALLPGYGWALATIFMALLVLKTTDADVWPDAVVMIVGSNVIWLAAYLAVYN